LWPSGSVWYPELNGEETEKTECGAGSRTWQAQMKRHNAPSNLENLTGEIGAKQNNVLWPDTLRNSRSVDVFLWKGSPAPTLVQRIGAWAFGLFYIGLALLALSLARQTGRRWMAIIVVALVYAGVRMCINGCRGHSLSFQSRSQKKTPL
jgi:hypothetical protein